MRNALNDFSQTSGILKEQGLNVLFLQLRNSLDIGQVHQQQDYGRMRDVRRSFFRSNITLEITVVLPQIYQSLIELPNRRDEQLDRAKGGGPSSRATTY